MVIGERHFFIRSYDIADKKTFISFYKERYFEIFGNSRYIESEIEGILLRGITTKSDIIRILAWKIGKIKHSESEKNSEFCYSQDWIDAEDSEGASVYAIPGLEKFVSVIADQAGNLKKLSEKDPQQVIDQIKAHAPSGIGTVYILCLLHFISNGRHPIYDKYACTAVKAIKDGIKPNDGVMDYSPLPNKGSKLFSNVYDIYKSQYVNLLGDVFGDEYKGNRDIDRALWAYGHEFLYE